MVTFVGTLSESGFIFTKLCTICYGKNSINNKMFILKIFDKIFQIIIRKKKVANANLLKS